MSSIFGTTSGNQRFASTAWPTTAGAPVGNAPLASLARMALPLIAALVFGALVVLAEVNAVVVFLSLLACVFILLDFRIGVVLLAVLLPLSASVMFPREIGGISGLNPINLLIVGTLGACLLNRPAAGEVRAPLPPPPLVWLYVLPIVLAGVAGAQHLGSVSPALIAIIPLDFSSLQGYLLNLTVKPLLIVVFAVLVSVAVVRSQRPERFILPMLLAVGVMCLVTIGYTLKSGISLADLSSSRARTFLSPLGLHANDLGRLYAIAYALMLFTFAATRDGFLRLALLGSMALVIVALTLTFSRGAFFGFAVVNLLFLLSRRTATSFMLGGAVMVALVLMAPDAVFERISAGWDGGLNAISAGRVDEIWLPLLPELLHSPLIGNGTSAIAWSEAMRTGAMQTVGHAHNAYLHTLLDMGVVGLVALCAYFAHVWYGFRRLANDAAISPTLRGFYAGAAAGLVSFMLAAFFGSRLTPVLEQIFLWLAIGMMYGQMHLARESATTGGAAR